MKHIFESRITAIMAMSGLVMIMNSVSLLWLIIRGINPPGLYEVSEGLYFAGIALLFFGLYCNLRLKKHKRKEKEVEE